jgi:hypothetical protein
MRPHVPKAACDKQRLFNNDGFKKRHLYAHLHDVWIGVQRVALLTFAKK